MKNFSAENKSLVAGSMGYDNVAGLTDLRAIYVLFVLSILIIIYRKYAYEVMEYEVLPLADRAVKYDSENTPARLKPKHAMRSVSVFEELDEDSF
jgi:hypothetical protein